MNISHYFIKHPVSTLVLNAMLAILGLVCLTKLSLREYPELSFPTIYVTAYYPNASAELVETAVSNILEERLAGLNGLETLRSHSYPNKAQMSLSFHSNTSMIEALRATQDAVNLAKPYLPLEVKAPTIERQHEASEIPFIALSLESKTRDFGELTHYANLHLKNVFRSLPGVSSVDLWGQPYTYKIKLSPKKLYAFGINVDEVTEALAHSQLNLPVGSYRNTLPSTLRTELKTPEDYEQLLIKTQDNHPIFLQSLAKISLETEDNLFRSRLNGHAGLVIALSRAKEANPLEVSKEILKTLENLKKTLPQDLKIKLIINQAEFVQASIKSIGSAIGEAILLVLAIIFLFLRNLKATLIPLLTIPISLLGTMIFLYLFGFSINIMSLLAMVLAIGLVVDDAIIVLEQIHRQIETGLSPLDAALKGSKEIGFAIIAMTLTLTCVYLPIALIDGILGQLFIEFAAALAGSVLVSGIIALSLSPWMCAKLLKKAPLSSNKRSNQSLVKLTQIYTRILQRLSLYPKTMLAFLLSSLLLSLSLYHFIPHETVPKEDRGVIGVFLPKTAGDSLDDTDEKMKKIEKELKGFSSARNQITFMGDWGGSVLLPLKPLNERKQKAQDLVEDLKSRLDSYPSVDPMVWSWDRALPGLEEDDRSSELKVIISTTESSRDLFNTVEDFKNKLSQLKLFDSVSQDLRLDNLGYKIELDHNQLAKLGLKPSQVAKTIEVFFSGDKSQTFTKDGILYNLSLQGEKSPWSLNSLYLTTAQGKRISLGAIAQMKMETQPERLTHIQQLRATNLRLQLKKGDNPSQALTKIIALAKEHLPPSYHLSLSKSAKTLQSSNKNLILLVFLSLIFIYSILALQFQNFLDPLLILVTVPLACSGGFLLTHLCGLSLNIYSQIGLITLIGLISKHGILMVEFANQLKASGLSSAKAIEKAASLRLRPILMTTGAMVFGSLPLLFSQDYGSESRYAIGTVLISGLTLGTLLTLFVLPVVYQIFKSNCKTYSEI